MIFLFKKLQIEIFPCLSKLFLNFDKTVVAVIKKEFSTFPEEHVEEKCFFLMKTQFFIWTSSKTILFFSNTLSARIPEQDSTDKEGRSWALIVFPNLNERH